MDQLQVWRDWRHDTAEFPPVSEIPAEDVRSRRRPGLGHALGAALLFGALVVTVLTALTAVGVGPVARFVSSGDGHDSRSGTSGATLSNAATPDSSGSTAGAASPSPVPTDTPTAPGHGRPGNERPAPVGPAVRRGAPPTPPAGGPGG